MWEAFRAHKIKLGLSWPLVLLRWSFKCWYVTPCTRSGGRPAEKDPVTGANATKCLALTADGGFQAEEWSFMFLSSCGVFLLAARLFLQQSPGSGLKSEPDEGATLAVWWVLGPLLPPPVAVCIPRFDAAADPPLRSSIQIQTNGAPSSRWRPGCTWKNQTVAKLSDNLPWRRRGKSWIITRRLHF